MGCDCAAAGRNQPGRIHPELRRRFGHGGNQGGGSQHFGRTKRDKSRSIDRVVDEVLGAWSVTPGQFDGFGGQLELDESILGTHRREHVVDGGDGGGVGGRVFDENHQLHPIIQLIEAKQQCRRVHQDGRPQAPPAKNPEHDDPVISFDQPELARGKGTEQMGTGHRWPELMSGGLANKTMHIDHSAATWSRQLWLGSYPRERRAASIESNVSNSPITRVAFTPGKVESTNSIEGRFMIVSAAAMM